MIYCVVGKVGEGKSYDMTVAMCKHLVSGGAVRTNIRLDYRQIGVALGRSLRSWQVGLIDQDTDPATIPTGDRRGRGRRRVLVVLDEALNWFDSATSSAKDDPRRERWSRWVRQSDKLGQDVYFLAQSFERAAKWIRELAAVCIHVVGLRNVHLLGIPFGHLPLFCNLYGRRVVDVRTGRVLSWSIRRYSSYYWRFYDTSETFGFTAADNVFDSGGLFPAHAPIVWPWPILVALFVLERLLWF